jgi:hypothetical protein
MAPKTISQAELVKRWDNAISPGTLANWRSLGKGPPYIKLGGRVRYPLDALAAWEKENTHRGKE